jgi:hypothetical protein
MPEQVINSTGFFSYLARHGLIVELPAIASTPQRERLNGAV